MAWHAAAAAKSLQSCPTLCDPIDGSPPGPAVPGILQARTLEWVAISSSNAWKWKVKVKSLSHVRLLATPWTAAYQTPPSMGFSWQECWSGLPFPSPGDLPNPGIELGSLALQADTLPSEPPGTSSVFWSLLNWNYLSWLPHLIYSECPLPNNFFLFVFCLLLLLLLLLSLFCLFVLGLPC